MVKAMRAVESVRGTHLRTGNRRLARGRGSASITRAAWTQVAQKSDLEANGGRMVVETSKGRVLLQELEGEIYAVSNKCPHLGLPLVGKTALFQGQVQSGCIVCPAHGTAFDLKSGDVRGEWCPKLPNLPLVGKGPPEKPLPTFPIKIEEGGAIAVDI